MLRSVYLAVSIAFLAASAVAQTRVVALTSTNQYLVTQQVDGGSCSSVQCGVNLEVAARPSDGGTAYDARSGIVWVSNGRLLGAYHATATGAPACRGACRPFTLPGPATRRCTGLAFMDSGAAAGSTPGPNGQLFILYDDGKVGVADVTGCVVSNPRLCQPTLIRLIGYYGGLACDELGRRVFVGGSGGQVEIFRPDQTCTRVCQLRVSVPTGACRGTFGDIRGLAYDGCRRVLFATDGHRTVWGEIQTTGTTCRWVFRGCCNGSTTEPYTGLALLPKPQLRAGAACSAAPCSSCAPVVRTVGNAVLGNGSFAVQLSGAPSNSLGLMLAIGIGPCGLPGANLGFCQPVLVSFAAPGPYLVSLPANPIPGTCARSATLPLPLPLNPAACNLRVSFQWLAVCGFQASGNALTECLTVRLGSL